MAVEPRFAQAMLNVLTAMSAREGARMPSVDVQRAAVSIDVQKVGRSTLPVQLWHVEGSRGIRYMVALTMESHDHYADVIDAECSCPAGESKTTCKHVLYVLARADLNGNHLRP